MGFHAPKNSSIIRLFYGFFLNINTIIQHTPEIWSKHYNVGKIETAMPDSKTAVIILKDLNVSPLFCEYLRGYFTGGMLIAKDVKNVSIVEKKCTYKGDKHHEYVIEFDLKND